MGFLHLGAWRHPIELTCGDDFQGSWDIGSASSTGVIIMVSAQSVNAAVAAGGKADDADEGIGVTG